MIKKVYIQIVLIFSAVFALLFLIYFLFYRREKNIQKYATTKVVGRVVRYSYLNSSDLAALPVVEYVVDGKIYEKRLSYSSYETTTSRKSKAEVLDTKYIRSPYHVLNLEKTFPIGSKMSVWYNPQKPQQGFVERYPGHDRILRIQMIIFLLVYLLLIVLFTFVYLI